MPDLEDIISFEELVSLEGMSGEAKESAGLVDAAVSNLAKNFTEGTEYFKVNVTHEIDTGI